MTLPLLATQKFIHCKSMDLSRSITNTLFHGDCLLVLGSLPNETIDLIYADPPFFSNRSYQVGTNLAFDDKWDGGMDQYIDWISPVLLECKRVLKSTGSIYLHCDPHASHYLKILMDKIFGIRNFVNEIIWKRQSAHNDVKQGARHFGRIHDTILFYSKSKKFIWNTLYLPYDKTYIRKCYNMVEPNTDRRFALGDLTAPGGASKRNPYYEFLGIRRYWRYSQRRMKKLYKSERIFVSKPGKVPKLKRYFDEMPGIPLQDIWFDKESRTYSGQSMSYPTQKPESLSNRIIQASSNPGDIILDPFCGSGTTLVSAHRFHRLWIGIDVSEIALATTKERLSKAGALVTIRRPEWLSVKRF